MFHPQQLLAPADTHGTINQAYRMDEPTLIKMLCKAGALNAEQAASTRAKASTLMHAVREARKKATGIDSFLAQYALSSEEGIALMCLAEALLRVPDAENRDRLIKDKLSNANWASHRGQSESFFVNATTWALMLTGKVLNPEQAGNRLSKALYTVLNRSGEPVVRKAVDQAMRIMSKQFVMGRTIDEALTRAQTLEAKGYRYSYDMLGESALTQEDAERYQQAYLAAIDAIGQAKPKEVPLYEKPGVSIKLSALHPRYSEAKRDRVMAELTPKLLELCERAKYYQIALTVDAEESERLALSLEVMEAVIAKPSLRDWMGFGLALQSYQKRAFFVIDWIVEVAKKYQRRMMVRLIKGAYWDSEIKKAQMQGLSDYPVFTRKNYTDVSFQACAVKILQNREYIYPQFATHNAYSVAMILSLVGDYRDFEFQCLHGMGKELYEEITPKNTLGIPCRIYAPVGTHEDLLPYLVRRLLENGANSSFVNRIVDETTPISDLVFDPIMRAQEQLQHSKRPMPLPKDIFMPERQNSEGVDLSDRAVLAQWQGYYREQGQFSWQASALVSGKARVSAKQPVYSPVNKGLFIGEVAQSQLQDVEDALRAAEQAFPSWAAKPVQQRANCLIKAAKLMEERKFFLYSLLVMEAGKTWTDAIAEVREAIDFCYYYAKQAKKLQEKPIHLKGYTGETNELSLHARGVVLCISPWNFPLAIFMGQITAALAVGNTVVAKPAEQTPMIAFEAVKILLEAGIPNDALHLLPGRGEVVGAALVADTRVKAVVFTGSTETAKLINQTLASRQGEIIPLIAETGGQNAMIVDSSALLEQVINDAINSAFGSAGQRCSALRVLFVQEEVYPRAMTLLKGAMAELAMGNPMWLSTDIGPVIDAEAKAQIDTHISHFRAQSAVIAEVSVPDAAKDGFFVAPTAIALGNLNELTREVFGPVLHVLPFKLQELDAVIASINKTGYGLTLGIHSRIQETVQYILDRVEVGNCYVNRNMIGAVVGLQPFGGQGLSGTGPKAGGPFYLPRFCHERTVTVDTTAAGGNASLMALVESM